MRQQARPWPTAFDGARWQSRLRELFAAFAGKTRAGDLVHDEPARDVFQLLGDILADPAQRAAACAVILGRQKLYVVAGDVIRDGMAPGLALGLIGRKLHLRCHRRLGDLARFQCQHQLSGLLRGRAVVPGLLACDLMPELLDQHRLGFDLGQKLGRKLLQLSVFFRQCHRLGDHNGMLHHWNS